MDRRGGHDAAATEIAEQRAAAEKSVLVPLDGMRLQLDDEARRERADPFDARRRIDRRQRKEQIGQPVPAREDAIHRAPIHAVDQALLAGVEAEVPSYERSGG